MARYLSHRNPNGHICHCPFGDPNKEKYQSPNDQEHLGSWETQKESMWREASKLEWLRDREDMKTPEAQGFLNHLESHLPAHDVLYPWLAREWKKGRLTADTYNDHSADYQDPYPLTYTDHQGYRQGMDDTYLQTLQDWMKYKKKAKQGVDIMQHEIGPAMNEARKWDTGGEPVHQFDNGMSVVKLRDRRDLRREGAQMGHCIGHSSQRYDKKLDDGESLFYSLRDHNNNPHATIEFEKDGPDDYFMCPSCKKPAAGERDHDGVYEWQNSPREDMENHPTYRALPEATKAHLEGMAQNHHPGESSREHAQHYVDTVMPEEDNQAVDWPSLYQDFSDRRPYASSQQCEHCNEPVPKDVKRYPVDLTKMKHPDARFTSPTQFYGPKDARVDEYHSDLMNEYFKNHGHDHVYSDGEDPEEEEDEEDFEPWWNDEYEVPGATDAQEYLDHHKHGELSEYAPLSYDNAVSDAYDHDLEPPMLYPAEPEYDSIIGSIVANSKRHGIDPHELNEVMKTAEDNGHADEFRYHMKEWLDNDYTPWLDPYGKENGPGYDAYNNQRQHPSNPGSHYPDTHRDEGDEYTARNFQYHLNKALDPQTGEELKAYEYPALHGPVDQHLPNPEREQREPYLHNNRQLDIFSQPVGYQADRTRPGIVPPTFPETPIPNYRTPVVPQQYFGPGNTDTHQLPFPQMRDQAPLRGDVENYPAGEAQGHLMPKSWYFDYRASRGSQSDLPPELFPPERFGVVQQHPHQLSLSKRLESTGNEQVGTYIERPGYNTQPFHYNTTDGFEPRWNTNTRQYDNMLPDKASGLLDKLPYRKMIQDHNEQRTAPMPGQMCYFHPDRPAVVADGFAGMCPECKIHWDENNAARHQGGVWSDAEQEARNQDVHQTQIHHGPRITEINPKAPFQMPGFEWRRPVVYHQGEDRIYVGQPGMEHADMMRQIGKEDPWNRNSFMPNEGMLPGYVDSTDKIGGGLGFFGGDDRVPNVDEFHDWTENHLGVARAKDPTFTDDDWITSKVGGEMWRDMNLPSDTHPEAIDWKQNPHPYKWSGPGQYGKGFLDDNGQVHTWNDVMSSPYWMHSSQARLRGVPKSYGSEFYINDDGTMNDEYGIVNSTKAKPIYEGMKKGHPDFTWPEYEGNAAPKAPEPEVDDAAWDDD